MLLACVGTPRTIDRIACYSLFFFIFTILLCEKDAVTPTGVMCNDRHPGMVLCLAFGRGSAAQTLYPMLDHDQLDFASLFLTRQKKKLPYPRLAIFHPETLLISNIHSPKQFLTKLLWSLMSIE